MPGVGADVEGVEVVGVGADVGFAAVDEDEVVSPEGGRVAAAFLGGWGGMGERGDEGPDKGVEVEAVDTVVYYTHQVSRCSI